MGKRYKKGNHGKKKGPRRNQKFYEQKKKLIGKYYILNHDIII